MPGQGPLLNKFQIKDAGTVKLFPNGWTRLADREVQPHPYKQFAFPEVENNPSKELLTEEELTILIQKRGKQVPDLERSCEFK